MTASVKYGGSSNSIPYHLEELMISKDQGISALLFVVGSLAPRHLTHSLFTSLPVFQSDHWHLFKTAPILKNDRKTAPDDFFKG